MTYRYFANENFEDFAGGRVIYHQAGFPNFPVRLAGEIFMHCLHMIGPPAGKVVLYDPCCGGGYLLTVLGFLCHRYIDSIYASDIADEAVKLAARNLALLTTQGLHKRKAQLVDLYNAFGKQSHADAIHSADALSHLLNGHRPPMDCTVFAADMMDPHVLADKHFKADIVFTDVPYGHLVSWSADTRFAADTLLQTIRPVLSDHAVVVICSNKSQQMANPHFKRIKKVILGKRKIEYFTADALAQATK